MITAEERQGLIVWYFLYGKELVPYSELRDVGIGKQMIFSEMVRRTYLNHQYRSGANTLYQLADKTIAEIQREN